MLAPKNHPEGCLCEWCMAAKSHERNLIRTETLNRTFTPSFAELTALDRVSTTRRKKYDRAVCPACSKELSVFNDGRFFNHKCVDGKWTSPAMLQ